ncbi:MAG: hypothetical protein MJ230_01765 [bacterium]|nr:hypothetical protein [bacterium]
MSCPRYGGKCTEYMCGYSENGKCKNDKKENKSGYMDKFLKVLDVASINEKNAEHYGLDITLDQLTEEMGEVIQAVNKLKRAKGKGQRVKVSVDDAEKNLIEELVDVQIVSKQVLHLLNADMSKVLDLHFKKVLRTEKRIENERGDNIG